MSLLRATLLASLLVTSICYAQAPHEGCSAGPATIVSHRDGITVKTVSFSGKSWTVTAHVFLPDADGPIPGIAFSQSAIHYADSTTDLLAFAHALARAGAASIMLDGTIEWQTPNDDYKRQWPEFDCAGQWFMANANLDPKRLAIGGPIDLKGGPPCESVNSEPCQPWIWVNYGWNEAKSIRATEHMKTLQGQLELASLVTESFHLNAVQLSWLVQDSSGSSLAHR